MHRRRQLLLRARSARASAAPQRLAANPQQQQQQRLMRLRPRLRASCLAPPLPRPPLRQARPPCWHGRRARRMAGRGLRRRRWLRCRGARRCRRTRGRRSATAATATRAGAAGAGGDAGGDAAAGGAAAAAEAVAQTLLPRERRTDERRVGVHQCISYDEQATSTSCGATSRIDGHSLFSSGRHVSGSLIMPALPCTSLEETGGAKLRPRKAQLP